MILFKLIILSYRRFLRGDELTFLLKTIGRRVPEVIAITAYDMREVYEDVDDEGLDLQEEMLGGLPDDYIHMLN